MKKTGLGGNPLQWIKDTKKEVKPKKVNQSKKKAVKKTNRQKQTSEVPKFRSYIKHSVLLSQEHLDHLHNLERAIMAQRKSGKERITKNSILRCYMDVFSSLNIDLRGIADEAELLKRIKANFRTSEVQKF